MTSAEMKTSLIEKIINDNYHKYYGLVYRITEDHQHTEDVLQNTFIKAFQNLDRFEGRASLSTWVSKIAINESLRFLKTWNKLPVIAITEHRGISEEVFFNTLQVESCFEDDLIIEEMREKCLRGFLRCVPKSMRICFLLKTCMGLKNKDIAEILDISEASAKITLYRARKKLKEMFLGRCSLIDPEKPCKCYLWVQYMRDHNRPLPTDHAQYKNEELKKEHFKNMSLLKKINYLYLVDEKLSKQEFLAQLKKTVPML